MANLCSKAVWFVGLLSLLVSGTLSAQENPTRLAAGLALESRLQSREVRVELHPSLQIAKNRHQLNIGPTLLLPFINHAKAKLNGLSLSYHYLLFPDSWLKPTAGLQLLGQRTSESWERNAWHEGSYQAIPASNLEHYAASLVGISINPLVTNNLRLSLGIAMGLYTASWQDTSPEPTTEFYQYAPYDASGLSYRARLGFSLSF